MENAIWFASGAAVASIIWILFHVPMANEARKLKAKVKDLEDKVKAKL